MSIALTVNNWYIIRNASSILQHFPIFNGIRWRRIRQKRCDRSDPRTISLQNFHTWVCVMHFTRNSSTIIVEHPCLMIMGMIPCTLSRGELRAIIRARRTSNLVGKYVVAHDQHHLHECEERKRDRTNQPRSFGTSRFAVCYVLSLRINPRKAIVPTRES